MTKSRFARTLMVGAVIATLVASLPLTLTAAADVEEWRAQIGGAPVDGQEQAQRQVVGGQIIASPSWMVSGFCGGTLIAPQWVLSAHHCGNRTGATYLIGGVETRTVAQYFPISGGEFNFGAPDLALWKLDFPSTQQPIEYARRSDLDDTGDFVYGIGYGNIGADIPNDGQLRSTGWIRVDKGTAYPWSFEYGDPGVTTCFGDSGGPVIGDASPPNAQLILVGVTSYTNGDGGNCTNLAGAAKVGDSAGWIQSTINANGGPGNGVPPTPTPPPVPLTLYPVLAWGYDEQFSTPTSGQFETGDASGMQVVADAVQIDFLDDDGSIGGDEQTNESSDDATQRVRLNGAEYRAFIDYGLEYTDGDGARYRFAIIDVDIDGDGDAPGRDVDPEDGRLIILRPGQTPPPVGAVLTLVPDSVVQPLTLSYSEIAPPVEPDPTPTPVPPTPTPTPTPEPPDLVPGDANCDGRSDIVDALVIAQYSTGLRSAASCGELGPDHIDLRSADLNDDGLVDIVDALIVARCAADLC